LHLGVAWRYTRAIGTDPIAQLNLPPTTERTTPMTATTAPAFSYRTAISTNIALGV